ncbi:hypothetical protein D092_20680 [Rhodococcus ruber Chol-4]|uniref:Uncharacterized protein n=1 Tax=Rhodococcus ruber TaxID=1830 RepID=A0A098BNV4_9NOCA|nr:MULTISPECIES: hypothetical protein [Rhodococcus]MDO2381021.1 hypothetical protein [Rhodococcus ruber]KXF84341.1 hypothetical protein D092_20680 [Rhodococcus ruber Chol-4]MCD2129198.1 hypothetical protein [Rhodococcus ruber]MCF8784299.1 hypothetical protein [Rhodococcus ruber]MCZ4505762.1 hypothetical protein [Rhodococcus ruber]
MTESGRGGRRREYASDADRVRAWRQRQKEQARAERLEAATPTDPAQAVTTLADAVPRLRQETQTALARLTEVAQSITAATALLADPAALDAHLRRVQADADKVRADAGAEIARLREQLDAALDERADADAAAAAALAQADDAATQLAAARREHRDELDRLHADHAAALDAWTTRVEESEAAHRRRTADLEALVEQQRDQLARLRAAAEQATATVGRLDADLAAARADAAAERDRTEAVRADLAAARAETAAARAQVDAARERADELRAELREVRAASATSGSTEAS